MRYMSKNVSIAKRKRKKHKGRTRGYIGYMMGHTSEYRMEKEKAGSARQKAVLIMALVPVLLVTACGGARQETAAEVAARTFPTPLGRVLTANQAANTVTLIDVATNTAYASIPTGQQPHHVVATPDGREFWVTLYGENRLQVFDASTLKEVASVDVGASNDDLTFDPEGKMLYVSLGKSDAVAIVDVLARKLVTTVRVGRAPHGVKVTPDGKYLLVTNTGDNTVSLLGLQPQPAVQATIRTGPDPFEVTVTADGRMAYVSNFLGDSLSVIDLAARKTVAYIKSGKQPAMLALEPSGAQDQSGQGRIWVAATGAGEVWVIDAATRNLVTRIPAGGGAHGVLMTPAGKVFVTNSNDGTVTIIDQASAKVLQTIAVGNNPNGLTYLPNVQGH